MHYVFHTPKHQVLNVMVLANIVNVSYLKLVTWYCCSDIGVTGLVFIVTT